jgi:hypothetical protein
MCFKRKEGNLIVADRDYALAAMTLDALTHPEHRNMLAYWQDRRGETGVPLRNRFDPLDFPTQLPRIAVIEVVEADGKFRFRYRLAGTEIASRAGRDPTGKFFEDLYEGTYLESAESTYLELMKLGLPHYSQRVFPIGGGESDLRYDRLIVPFSSDGKNADQFVLLIVVVEQTGRPSQKGSFKSYGAD